MTIILMTTVGTIVGFICGIVHGKTIELRSRANKSVLYFDGRL